MSVELGCVDVRTVGHGDEHDVEHGIPTQWGMETDESGVRARRT